VRTHVEAGGVNAATGRALLDLGERPSGVRTRVEPMIRDGRGGQSAEVVAQALGDVMGERLSGVGRGASGASRPPRFGLFAETGDYKEPVSLLGSTYLLWWKLASAPEATFRPLWGNCTTFESVSATGIVARKTRPRSVITTSSRPRSFATER
jgi:hypothetical protein